MNDSMPCKLGCIHFCFNDSIINTAWKNILDYSTDNYKGARCRVRCHTGTPQEVLFELMTFGIPCKALPITNIGMIDVKQHLENIEMKRIAEKLGGDHNNMDSPTLIMLPFRKDVVFGKGRRFQNHPGNMKLKLMVDELLPEYETLDKEAKTVLADRIVRVFKREGTRFLSQESGIWIESTDDSARSKVAQLFRNRREVAAKPADKEATPDTNPMKKCTKPSGGDSPVVSKKLKRNL